MWLWGKSPWFTREAGEKSIIKFEYYSPKEDEIWIWRCKELIINIEIGVVTIKGTSKYVKEVQRIVNRENKKTCSKWIKQCPKLIIINKINNIEINSSIRHVEKV